MMQEKNASTPLDLSSVAVLSVMFAPMMIRIGSYQTAPFLDISGRAEDVRGRTVNRIV